jgi:type IV pilus assembly protein PilA
MDMTNTKKGFTLIELMVVIVIIGILAAVAIPKLFGMTNKAKAAEAPGILHTYETLQSAYIAETSEAGGDEDIDFKNPSPTQYFTYENSLGTTTGSDDTSANLLATSSKTMGTCLAGGTWTTTVFVNGNAVTRVSGDGVTGNCGKLTPLYDNQ